jgi:hypothetical protein
MADHNNVTSWLLKGTKRLRQEIEESILMRVKVIPVEFPENCSRRLLVRPFTSKAFHNCLFMTVFIQSRSGTSGCIEGKSRPVSVGL